MESSDLSNRIRHQVFDTRPDTEFKLSVGATSCPDLVATDGLLTQESRPGRTLSELTSWLARYSIRSVLIGRTDFDTITSISDTILRWGSCMWHVAWFQ